MAILECPTRNDLPTYHYVIQLDGTNYTLSFYFNPRLAGDVSQGKWEITLGDQFGNIIAGPVPVVVTWPLFDRFKDLNIFPGTLFAFDSSNTNTDPGQFDLGDRVRILYSEVGTL